MIYVLNGITLTSIRNKIEEYDGPGILHIDYYRLLPHANKFILNIDTSSDNLLSAHNKILKFEAFADTIDKLLEDAISHVTGNLKNALSKSEADRNVTDKNYIAAFAKTEESFIPLFMVEDIDASTDASTNAPKTASFISGDATEYPDITSEDDLHINIHHLVQQSIIRSNLAVLRSVITQIEKAVE